MKSTYNSKLILATTVTILLSSFTMNILAQSYGGSAHVYVKNKDGNSRVLITTCSCTRNSESAAKSTLKSSLEYLKLVGEEFTSGISYDIDMCARNDSRSYGGTAWVKVENDKGKSRIINTDISCTRKTVADAKGALASSLEYLKMVNERFVSPANYDIDSCN